MSDHFRSVALSSSIFFFGVLSRDNDPSLGKVELALQLSASGGLHTAAVSALCEQLRRAMQWSLKGIPAIPCGVRS